MKFYRIKLWLLCLCFSCLAHIAAAQQDNSAFERTMPLLAKDTGVVSLWAEQLYYFKNNEYFTPFHDGYTLFGCASGPRLAWQPHPLVKISAGVYWRQDFGRSKAIELLPIFQFKYTKNNFSFLFGNLEGQAGRRLIEPLFDFERTILRRQEQGMQVEYKNEHFWAQAWVDWQQMIYNNDPNQEHLQGGLSLSYNHSFASGYTLAIPINMLAYHQGGQIDTSGLPIQTRLNSSLGISISKNISNKNISNKKVHVLKSEIYFLNFTENSPSPALSFTSGHGFYGNISSQNRWLTLMISYWQGYNYIAPASNRLFWSQGSVIDQTNIYQARRKLVFVRFLKNWNPAAGVDIGFRVEPVYDLASRKISFSHGVYVNFNTHIFLFRPKKIEQ